MNERLGIHVDNVLIGQGFDLMLFGMGTVFCFLTLLIFSTITMSRVITRFFPDIVVAEPKRNMGKASTASVDAKTLKLIQDAIHQHRAKQA
ncbi:MAG: oxaloacetate decarboxylase gamma subunit [Flavobacteriales bacterium]|jgi:oxaloacetate decarboxylase gamma subunit